MGVLLCDENFGMNFSCALSLGPIATSCHVACNTLSARTPDPGRVALEAQGGQKGGGGQFLGRHAHSKRDPESS